MDLSSVAIWTSVGNNLNSSNNFKGNFDGNNKTISNLTIGTLATPSYQNPTSGFFGTLSNGASIKNLTLANIAFYLNRSVAGAFIVGGLAGVASAGVQIDNCHVSGLINAINSDNVNGADIEIGGLIGKIQRGLDVAPESDLIQIINSSTDVDIVATSTSTFTTTDKKVYAAGFVSNMALASFVNLPILVNCYSKGDVSAESTVDFATTTSRQAVQVAGIWANNCGNLYNCYASGYLKGKTVTANVNVCGITGFINSGSITNCFATMDSIRTIANSGTQLGRRIANGTGTNQIVTAYSFENTKVNGTLASTFTTSNNVNGANTTLPDFIAGINAYVTTNPTSNGVTLKTWASIVAASNDLTKGVVTGATTALVGQTVTLTATPMSGKVFVRWTEGGTEVSTNANYTFLATANRSLVAEFINNTDPSVIAVSSISVETPTSTFQVGATYQSVANIVPFNASNNNITWSSSNSAVATVDVNGLVKAIARGNATITATTVDGNFKASFTFNVYSTTLSLASLFTNNMVLQQKTDAALWGWTAPNASVEICASWGQTATAIADGTGKWMTKIQTPAAVKGDVQTKHTLTFTGPVNSVTVQNILIGDVYFCSGQSNMLYPMNNVGPNGLGGVDNYASEILLANYPNIRYNKVDGNVQPVPVDYRSSSWTECSPTNAPGYSAAAYYFAKELYDDTKINIPIGLVVSAVGATRCQGWTSREAMAADPILKSTYLDPYDLNPTVVSSAINSATILYNGGIAPLIPFTINGFLWYQGEGNAGETTYTKLFSAMINDWRTRWGQDNLPFYFVQIAPYSAAGSNTGITREQQANTLVLPNTGMVVTTDIAPDLTNIHPTNKKEVGKRLALWAKAKIYAEDIVYTGPMYKSMKVEGNKIRISFHPASIGSGLATIGSVTALNEFTIGGADNIMVAADAVIDGNDVLVSATSVPNPTNVWFAYKKNPLPTLRNKERLPASPFRTNGWENAIDISTSPLTSVQAPKNKGVQITRMNESVVISGFPMGKMMQIYNTLGVQVYSTKVSSESVTVALPKGVYLLKELGKPFMIQ